MNNFELIFFNFLHYLNIYNFDFFFDTDLQIKFVYQETLIYHDLILKGLDENLTDSLFVNINDFRNNGFF